MTSTWAMKKKANGTYRARLNAQGFEQVDGVHYDSHSISAPVTNDATIRIVLVMMIMAKWCGELLDIKGAFLHGDFENGEDLCMEIPEGFEKHYDVNNFVLKLLQTIYGLKQAAMAFWRTLLQAFASMGYTKSQADPCLYFNWTEKGLSVWISWIDDCLTVGKNMKTAKQKMIDRFDCDAIGNMDEYVGCKVERNVESGWIRLTQPVLLKSYVDEFDLPDANTPTTPAVPGQVLTGCKEEEGLSAEMQTKYRSGVGKLLHMMRWSRPEILNPVRDLSRHMQKASMAHYQAMLRVMHYCVSTPKRGLVLNPYGEWDGSPDYEFVVNGLSDANYAKDTDTRRSVSGHATFLNGAPITMRSGQQKTVTLSTAEAELMSGTQCAQDMMFIMRVMESIGLKVKKPMILEIDNKGAVALANNWSIGGRTRHIEVWQYFLRDLKAEGLITTKWKSGDEMSSDLFTKNLAIKTFEKHAAKFVGQDQVYDRNRGLKRGECRSSGYEFRYWFE